MKKIFLAALLALAPVAADAQFLSTGGNIDGNGNITYTGSNMSGHLYGNGAFTVSGLTLFNISSPTNGQCLTYSTGLSAWINSSGCSGGGGITLPTGFSFTGTNNTDLKFVSPWGSTGQLEFFFTGGVWQTIIRGDEIHMSDGTNTIAPGGNILTSTTFNAIQHVRNHFHIEAANGELFFTDVSQGSNSEEWGMDYAGGSLALHTNTDNSGAPAKNALDFERSGLAITSIEYGNTTDHPLHQFDGGIVVGAPTGGNKGNGTVNATGLYVNGTAVGGGGGSPGGSDTNVQFNSSGSFGGSNAFLWNNSTHNLQLIATASQSSPLFTLSSVLGAAGETIVYDDSNGSGASYFRENYSGGIYNVGVTNAFGADTERGLEITTGSNQVISATLRSNGSHALGINSSGAVNVNGSSGTTGTVLTSHGFSGASWDKPYLSSTSASVGGGALSAGACASVATSTPGAVPNQGVIVTPDTYPGDGFYWMGYIDAFDSVTVKICSVVGGTPTASVYEIRVFK